MSAEHEAYEALVETEQSNSWWVVFHWQWEAYRDAGRRLEVRMGQSTMKPCQLSSVPLYLPSEFNMCVDFFAAESGQT